KFSDIIDNRIYIKQQKTGNVIALKLHKTALEIIEKQRLKYKDKVFNIPNYECWNRKVKEIIKQIGITRHITGHCARHSFGTLCARKNINPLVIQQMMGHGDLKTTMEYINISGEQLDEAIDKLSN
ncbi:MAG: tyrosine-type recombinase/integrase, partial [Candidatus Cloacimonetes bacterium]|nr:tyrosine-type recombinase/integrase [Candidatus Cloacimonadota bacterium]